MKIENIPTADLIPYINNAKKHDDDQINKLASSIKNFGFCDPIEIDAQNEIIAGHGRLLAAKKLGLETVPCVRHTHLTDAQRRAYTLANNKLQELGGGWDADILRIQLDSIGEEFDLGDLGFDEDQTIAEINEKQEAIFEQSIQLSPQDILLVIKMTQEELENTIKNKFKHLSNKALIERINRRFSRGLNDDDEVFEMQRRSNAGKLKFKVGYDTYELVD
jgi:hypothetical protein